MYVFVLTSCTNHFPFLIPRTYLSLKCVLSDCISIIRLLLLYFTLTSFSFFFVRVSCSCTWCLAAPAQTVVSWILYALHSYFFNCWVNKVKSHFQRTYVNFSDGLRADVESGCGAERCYSVVAVCGAAAAAAAACAAGGNNSPRCEALLLNIGPRVTDGAGGAPV